MELLRGNGKDLIEKLKSVTARGHAAAVCAKRHLAEVVVLKRYAAERVDQLGDQLAIKMSLGRQVPELESEQPDEKGSRYIAGCCRHFEGPAHGWLKPVHRRIVPLTARINSLLVRSATSH